MKIKSFILLYSCIFYINGLYAQEYSVSSIADSLIKDADAVVREYDATFIQHNINSATYKRKEVITILNAKGNSFANFHTYEDNFRSLSSFSGIIRNARGEVIRKIKKSDLTFSSISMDALATGTTDILFTYKSPAYPFTIEYSYEQKLKNGIIGLPNFFPISGYSVAVEKAIYTIETPSDIKIRYKGLNGCKIDETNDVNKNRYTASLINIKPVPYEICSPPAEKIVPSAYFAPSKFCYDSQCGDFSTWNDYGLWAYKLLIGRDELPTELKSKLIELTKNTEDEKEKIKLVFEYMQKNSRYVSIQLGIGGFQPFDATTVAKTKFGDCKGLSNLMKAMLKAVDIPSEYCEIRSGGKKDLDKNFSNITQTNHAILMVPLKADTLWLECTSQTLPFAYIHPNIAGHDALVITKDGGKVCRLPSFNDNKNLTTTQIEYQLNENGGINGKVSIIEYLDYSFETNDRTEFIKRINSYLKMPEVSFGEISTYEHKSTYPYTKIESELQADKFANKTGSRLFLPLYPLRKSYASIFSASTRNLDIEIEKGFSENDTIIISIPETYTVESLPKNIELETPFGKLTTNIEQKENKIIYTQNIDIFSGQYTKDSYKEIKEFYSAITNTINKKLVLKQI